MPKINFSSLKKIKLFLFIYTFLLGIYAIFSYSLTAPNLILTNWEPYWLFQGWMWSTFFNNRSLLSWAYLGLTILLWIIYFLILKYLKKTNTKLQWYIPLIITLPLLFSSNALSYDIFNYIFNAKIVVVYHANPHIKVALDYYYDDWTRFMHNTNTPAPYFYGWTVLSLLPFVLGFKKFLLTLISFRFFSYLSYLLLVVVIKYFKQLKLNYWSTILLLNPLLLIEVIGNSHNDLWMMIPAVLAILMIKFDNKNFIKITASFILLLISISIKLATLTLLPLWIYLLLGHTQLLNFKNNLINQIKPYYALMASLLMFVPLLTFRSKFFLPWYIIWSIVWLPWLNHKNQLSYNWTIGLILLTVSSSFRYLPQLWYGNYDFPVIDLQLLITWTPFICYWIYILCLSLNKVIRQKKYFLHQ